jgi:hypothetical protein
MSNSVTKNGVAIVGSLSKAAGGKNQHVFSKIVSPPSINPLSAANIRLTIEDVDVNVPSLVNRDTELGNLIRILKNRGGFDSTRWNEPQIARLPDGRMFLFDGDHSRHLYKHFFSEAKTMPAKVRNVANEAEVSRLFIDYNCKGKTPIASEHVFVHHVLAGDEEAIVLAGRLAAVGLQVYCSNEPNGVAGAINGVRVKVGGVAEAFKKADKAIKKSKLPQGTNIQSEGNALVADAVSLVKFVTNHQQGSKELMRSELLEGVMMLMASHPSLRCGQGNKVLRQWLSKRFSDSALMDEINFFKLTGGGLVNHAGYSIARGLVLVMSNAVNEGKLKNLGALPSINNVDYYFKPRVRKKK